MNMGTLQLWAWPASAFTAACVGLAAAGYNILKMLNVRSLVKPLSYLAGFAGALALCVYCSDRTNPIITRISASGNTFNSLAWMISALTALGVGLAALGCDVLKSCGISSSRKALQYVVGAAGIYCLVLYYR